MVADSQARELVAKADEDEAAEQSDKTDAETNTGDEAGSPKKPSEKKKGKKKKG